MLTKSIYTRRQKAKSHQAPHAGSIEQMSFSRFFFLNRS